MECHPVLRLKPEPCEEFSEAQVHRLIMESPEGFCDLLDRFYAEWNRNRDMVTLPPKQVFSTEGLKGDFRVMPCVFNFEGKLVKAVKVIGTNEEERIVPDKICVGRAMLLHPTDNFAQALFEVCALSSFRTAAISVLAAKRCATGLLRAGIIGTGRIGFYTALFLKNWLRIGELSYFDLDPARAREFKFAIEPFMCGMDARECGSVEEVSAESNALFLCTNSAVPVLSKKNARNLPFVSSVGADADNLSELDEDMAPDRQIVVDSIQSMALGDMKRWEEKGIISREEVLEMRSVATPGYKPAKKVLFISTGVAVQDALACQFLFERRKREKTPLKMVLPSKMALTNIKKGDGILG